MAICKDCETVKEEFMPEKDGSDDSTNALVMDTLLSAKGVEAFISEDVQEEDELLSLEFKALSLTNAQIDQLNAPWEMFSAQLGKQIAGSANWQGLQFVSIPKAANWNDPKTGKWVAWSDIGDSLPAWGPTYRGTSRRITDGYLAFISNLLIPLPNAQLQEKANDAQKEYADAVEKWEKAREAVGDHWQSFNSKQASLPPDQRMDFDEWYETFESKKIAPYVSRAQLAAQKWTSYINQASGGYAFVADIIGRYNDDSFQMVAEDTNGKKRKYRVFDITPDLDQFIQQAKARPDTDPPRLSFTFNKSSERTRTWSEHIGGSVSFFGGFFGFGASAGSDRSGCDVTHDKFMMSFRAKDVRAFDIRPSGWFNGAAITAFPNGPWVEGPVKQGIVKLWGPDGILALIPNQIIVAVKPKVSCTVKSDEYKSFKSSYSAGGGISIGPFGFGGSYGRSDSTVTFDDASNTVTAEDKSDVPQIIAIVCDVMPAFS
jgi:hypothetical protein